MPKKIEKLKGGRDPLGKIVFKKSIKAKKNLSVDPLVSPGIVCYAEKEEKPFFVQFAMPNDSIWYHKIL